MPDVPSIETATAADLRAIRFVAFDFDGVFTDNTVYVSQDGTESVRCWRGDGLGLRKLERLGIGTAILSTEVNPVVGVRARKLRIACIQGLEDKRARLEALAGEVGIPLAAVAYVGNDINDLGCFVRRCKCRSPSATPTPTCSARSVTARRRPAAMARCARSVTFSRARIVKSRNP